jgi:methylated-DNA-[protein]-cysteine S-methyltransferase
MYRYTIIETAWGYFGLAAADAALARTCLPVETPNTARHVLLDGLKTTPDSVPFQRNLLPTLQKSVLAYFNGQIVDFSTETAIDLGKMGHFHKRVLEACSQIPFGKKTTYRGLAETIASPGAARAVGNALARNPIPLIIPCHRVLRTDGGLGGFSAIGATELKQRLLVHEQSHLRASVCAKA